MRLFVRLRMALMQIGLRRMQSDISMYQRLGRGELIGSLIIHFGDILYVCPGFYLIS